MRSKKIQSKVIKFSDSEFYFDDCAICQGMKKAEDEGKELNLNQLKSLFKKAGKKTNKK